ncbi:tRNA (adenosine(37)-N6)-threonylcarbamoyltransferase complex dimerization subunit type 1 TsaB [Patescibacteria group bacterium]|nr:tRNA (adenosine(37)-N6)-threonylcarbamoyltransferase complex dimerization subunit type 1 TsaB [Patescibacteria group bacterium]
MKLYIDTSQREEVTVSLDGEVFKTNSKKEKSQRLLPFIDETLKKKKLSLKDLTEIEVNIGPGSFTGLKVGVSVAQALGWALNIPVNGKNIREGKIIEINYK